MKRSGTRVAIAFDIDGVFKYGREWSADGLAALQKVSAKGMPFVFVTNGGGGLTEAVYGSHLKDKVVAAGEASETSGELAVPEAKRMVLSYTPWETLLCPDLRDKKVLLVGDPREKVLEVAASYGLQKAIHYSDYAVEHPTVNPFRAAMEAGTSHTAVANASKAPIAAKTSSYYVFSEAAEKEAEDPFRAILVMCDPYRWYEAIQVSVDVLCSPTPLKLEYDPQAEHMPIHFSNPDFLSKFEHPYPRFAQGAFKVALRALYEAKLRALRVPEETIGEKLGASFRQWGKPTEATFRFVEQRLRDLTPDGAGVVEKERFYMVGDNPASDMEGVRRANIFHRGSSTTWTGVLVKTGVYKEGDETNGATVVVSGVGEVRPPNTIQLLTRSGLLPFTCHERERVLAGCGVDLATRS